MNIFMKRILSILPWVAALLVIRAIKIKKINRELKTLEQLEEKNIDENNLKEILEKCSTSEEIFNIIENISK